ncbi:MAG: nitrate transporter permease [Verrucomicrobiota bacterium]
MEDVNIQSGAPEKGSLGEAFWSRLQALWKHLDSLFLPIGGLLVCLLAWQFIAGREVRRTEKDDFGDPITKVTRVGISSDLPSPVETWKASARYVVEPFAKRGELDQGILSFTWLSLKLVVQGYLLALVLGTPVGFLLGSSEVFRKAFDPIIQILRPVSPLAWLPLGMVLFLKTRVGIPGTHVVYTASELAAVFTVAVCSMWPTVLNTAVGVRAVPQDYLNVAKVLRLSRSQTLFKILLPATLPYMFTGYRLSLGIAWLVIVAAEMLTGRPGVGGFLWQQYNALSYAHIILCIVTIGVIGFVLDRAMSVVERKLKGA